MINNYNEGKRLQELADTKKDCIVGTTSKQCNLQSFQNLEARVNSSAGFTSPLQR